MNRFQQLLVLGIGVMSLGTVMAQAPAPAARTYSLNIESQALDAALNALATQSGLQVVFHSAVGEGLKSPRLEGTYSLEAALQRLLANTELRYELLNDRTVAIRARTEEKPRKSTSTQVSETMRLVQADDKAQEGRAAENTEAERENGGAKGVPEILVRGSRSLNADIQRTEDDIQPYLVFSAQEIERSMAMNLEEFLMKRLPMNTAAYSNRQVTSPGRGTESEINLRGLGPEETLILVNGRRMPGVSAIWDTGAFRQTDINGIPVTAVERIEVLPSTASGIYGGGATGGVVNVILKSDYRGLTLSGAYLNTFDTDAAQRRFDASAGVSFQEGKTYLLTAASFSDANDLKVGDRDFARQGREILMRNAPINFYQWGPRLAYTPNIRNTVYNSSIGDYAPLVLDSGVSLGSAYTYVPVGYAGVGTDGGSALLSNAGRQNLDLPDNFMGSRKSLLATPRTASLTLNLRHAFGNRAEVFIDLSGNRNNSSLAYNGSFNSTAYLPADAPNNPFTTTIAVAAQVPGSDYETVYTSETVNGTAGVVFRLPQGWVVATDLGWGRSRSSGAVAPRFLPTLDLALIDGTIDIISDLNRRSLDLSPYLVPHAEPRPHDSALRDITMRLAGSVLQLPAGPLSISSLVERRTEKLEATIDTAFDTFTGDLRGYIYRPRKKQGVDSVYVEATAPLFGGPATVTGIRRLDLQLSARSDEYSVTGLYGNTQTLLPSPDGPFPDVDYGRGKSRSTVYTAGLLYMPVEAMTLRASYSTGFLPPSVAQVGTLISDSQAFYDYDPKRGNEYVGWYPAPITFLTGGSSELKPERSRSYSAGLILTPVSGLRLSLDYTYINKFDEISRAGRQILLQIEDLLPGRIVRDPLTTVDAALGYTGGLINRIDETLINIAKTEVRALDMQVDYRWEQENWGTFSAYAIATRQMRYALQYLPTSDSVNASDFSDGPIEWRGSGGFNWNRGAWSANWNSQYIGSQFIHSSTSSQSTVDDIATRYGRSRWPSRLYHDLLIGYRFDDSPLTGVSTLLSGTQLMVGIQNVLDTSPPVGPTSGASGGHQVSHGDPRLRRYSISFRKDFR